MTITADIPVIKKIDSEQVTADSDSKPWEECEINYLRNAYTLGQADQITAAVLGRMVDSIKNKRRALGLCGKPRDGTCAVSHSGRDNKAKE